VKPYRRTVCPWCNGERWRLVRIGWGLRLVVCVPCGGYGRIGVRFQKLLAPGGWYG
jgi:NMD protein affecting ribosome stability and mRNA decay